MRIVSICACPTRIAYTYMAQAALEKAAKERGHEIKIEMQGAMGIENKLSQKDVANADVVIFAVGMSMVGEERFGGKLIVREDVSKAIQNPAKLIEKAEKQTIAKQ